MKRKILCFFLSLVILSTCLPVGILAENDDYSNTEASANTEEPVSTDEHIHAYTETIISPTCTEQGYTSHVCVCGDSYNDDYTDALGHNFVGEKCETCGEDNPDYAPVLENPFDDVTEGRFFYYPVLWAVDKKITEGTTESTFSPDVVCNRAQMVTFLWRAVGCPAPTTTENVFVDVDEDSVYYDAIMWAVETGVTKGVDASHFDPGKAVTRGQAVTFLYRAENEPQMESYKTQFKDVNADSFCGPAVAWASKNGVTLGVTYNSFEPYSACTRAQIVTFLYRCLIPTYSASDSESEKAGGNLQIDKIDGHSGDFLIRAEDVSCNSDIQTVSVAVWSEADKSDLFWYNMQNVSEGIYEASGNVKSHQNQFGSYNAELYIYTASNKRIDIGSTSFSVEADNYLYSKDIGNRKIELILLGAPSDAASIDFGVTKCGDDTAKTAWFSATLNGSSYVATLDGMAFTASGEYSAIAYVNDKSSTVAETTFNMPKSYIMSENQLRIYNACEKIYASSGKDLKACFNYAASLPYYRATPEPQKGYTESEWYALYGFDNGKGHCYVHAATFYWLAKNLGYECYYIEGYVPRKGGGLITHGWVEIVIDGTLYVCDPNFTNETGKNGYMIKYGMSGTWYYTQYNRMD